MRSAINGEGSIACNAVSIQLNKELTASIDLYDVIGDICLSPFKSQMDMLYEPLKSRFQTLSSLHSKPDATLSQQVKFSLFTPSQNSYCDVCLSFLYKLKCTVQPLSLTNFDFIP